MKNRVHAIDELRGFCLIFMVIYHGIYNLVTFLGFNSAILYNPLMSFLQTLFASSFILLCGISCSFSRNNLKRGLKILLFALIVTIVTYIMNNNLFVKFGILHFLAFATIFYGLLQKHLKNISYIIPFLFLILFILTDNILDTTFDIPYLWFLGIRTPSFSSSDYFPIFPWIFMFFIGVYLGKVIKNNAFPLWFYKMKPTFLSVIGKKSLLIYLLHQPILMAFVYLILFLRS